MLVLDYATQALTASLALLGLSSDQTNKGIKDSLELSSTMDSFSGDVTKCPGYTLSNLKETKDGVTADLKLAGPACNAYGTDIKYLILEVEYQSESRVHVHIYDSDETQYQIPTKIWPRPPCPGSKKRNLEFHHESSPFAFWITRKSGEIIFDTRPSSIASTHTEPIIKAGNPIEDSTLLAYPLVFEDQYLQLSTALPEDANIYGLGEVIATSGLRRDPNGTIATLWNRDSAGVPVDSNLYGTHPFYLETRYAESGPSKSHGVFLLNSHGMDVLLRSGVLEYRVLGGTLDLYFFSGPTAMDVTRQYAEVAGKPAKMPFWAFGFHLCRWDGQWVDLTKMKGVVERMRNEGIPLETMWSDLDYMDRYRDFEVNDKFK